LHRVYLAAGDKNLKQAKKTEIVRSKVEVDLAALQRRKGKKLANLREDMQANKYY